MIEDFVKASKLRVEVHKVGDNHVVSLIHTTSTVHFQFIMYAGQARQLLDELDAAITEACNQNNEAPGG